MYIFHRGLRAVPSYYADTLFLFQYSHLMLPLRLVQ